MHQSAEVAADATSSDGLAEARRLAAGGRIGEALVLLGRLVDDAAASATARELLAALRAGAGGGRRAEAEAALVQATAELRRANRRSSLDLAPELRAMMWSRGFLADRWFLLDIANKGFDGYLSDLQRLMARRINGGHGIVLDDKLLFAQVAGGVLPHPEILVGVEAGRIVEHPGWRAALERVAPTPLFVKPTLGAMGLGVRRVTLRDGAVETGTAAVAAERFLGELAASRVRQIVTVGVDQHAGAARWNPGTINTLRVLSIRDPATGRPEVPLAVLRVGTAASGIVDNFARGALSFAIDRVTGRIGPGVRRVGAGTMPVEVHPDSGVAITGDVVPHWPAVTALAVRALEHMPYLAYVGWDIAIGRDGPVIIEGNSYTGVDVFQVHAPILHNAAMRSFYAHHGILAVAGPAAT